MCADHRAPGSRLGPYELLRPLGSGGAGEVWEASLHGPGGFRKPVALKLLHHGVHDEQLAAMLLKEARLGALLQHPNVVSTLQLGEHDGVLCVALELVRGASLEEFLRRGPLPGSAVVEVGVQVAAALQHIHEFRVDGRAAGLVHRDVKPANLLVDRAGVVKLVDLGISLVSGETVGVAGTPGYMAPEQLAGRPEPRSDLFSLGATLYLLATARRPFGRGAQAMAAVRRVEEVLADPAFLAPLDAVVPGLGAVVGACLRHDPADRLPSAQAVGAALAALRGHARGPSLAELVRGERTPGRVEATPSLTEPTRLLPVGNLHVPRDPFVGREQELDELGALVQTSPWVVVLGPGGMGKTRLVLEVGRGAQQRMDGGCWAFDLSGARSVDGICAAMAAAFRLELDRHDPVGQLGRVLAARGRCLVVLDNLEQCVGALPETLGRWLTLAPEARFVGTSRVLPGLAGEQVLALGQLPVQDAERLFVARAPRPLRDEERADVAALAAALEGMPLAIELAAARLRAVSVAVIRERLSLGLLAGGSADRPERHRSVLASLRWSWELLSGAGRLALAQLSVFEGGFDLGAAEAVLDLRSLPDAPWALDVLQELVDASLLQVDPAETRFRTRHVVREFGATLASPEARLAAERRHGEHFAQLGAPEMLVAADGRDGRVRHRLALELDNVVAACRRAVARGDADVAVPALLAAGTVLTRRGPIAASVVLAEQVCAMALGPEQRILAELELGSGLRLVGPRETARSHFERALELARELGDPRAEASAHGRLGALEQGLGRLDEAREQYELAIELARRCGERRTEGIALGNLATTWLGQDRQERALAWFEQALALHRAVDDRRSEGITLVNLGVLYRDLARAEDALDHVGRSLQVAGEVGERRLEAAALLNLSLLYADAGRSDEASAALQRALDVARRDGDRGAEAWLLRLLGMNERDRGRLDEARSLLEGAVQAHRELGDVVSEGVALGDLAEVHAAGGRLAEGFACLDEAEGRLRGAKVIGDLAPLLVQRARVARAAGDRGAAQAAWDEARDIAQRLDEGARARLLAALGEGIDDV